MNELFIEENIKTTNNGYTTLLWNDFNSDQENNIYSINQIIEKDQVFYKKKILSIGNIYFKKIWRKSKLNYTIGDNFDYFFLSSIFHQSPFYKDSLHLLTIKFFVIREFIKQKKIFKVHINISNKDFSDLIYKYCISKNIKVKINYRYENKLNRIFSKLNKSKNYLKKIILLISKINFKEKEFTINKNDMLLFDIFTHFNLEDLKKGKYKSFYWNSLIDLIKKNNLKVKWIHLFYPTKAIRFLNDANKITNILNKEANNNNHLILENLFSIKSAFIALTKYLKITIKYLIHKKSLKIINTSAFSGFNKILNSHLMDTFIGYRSLRNIFFYECFHNLIKRIENPKLGLYVMENLDFELILNHLWKKKFNCELIGFPHSNVRYWDLRYFFLDPNEFKNIYPNKVLIHSKDTLDWANNIKINSKSAIAVESLRYENLILKKQIFKKSNLKNFLVFADLDESISEALFKIFENNKDKNFFVKSHPGSSMNKKNYKNISFIKDNEHIFDNYDCVIVSNASGAVFKPYYENFPFLVFLDTRFFNLNPISDLNKNIFFHNHSSFERSIHYILKENNGNKKLHIIDNKNQEWLNILKHKDIYRDFNQINCQKLIDH